MNANEKNLFLLGFTLSYREDHLEVYTNKHSSFEIEVACFFNSELRIIISTKFDSTEIKFSRKFPLLSMVNTRTEINFEKLKKSIIETLNMFSDTLVGKSNDFAKEVKRIDIIEYINFD